MNSAVDALLARARGPTGSPGPVEVASTSGPWAELARLLSTRNGFFLFNVGVQVFRVGSGGIGPELMEWNDPSVWKNTYGALAENLFCFAQDLFGVQFAIDGNERVVSFDPETGERTTIGDTVEEWAAWLLEDPDVRAGYGFAAAWQDEHGALNPNERLMPRRLFVLGGEYVFANLTVTGAVEAMRIRGPLAQHIGRLPEGSGLALGSSHYTRLDLEVTPSSGVFFLQDEAVRLAGWSTWLTETVLDRFVAAGPGIVAIRASSSTTVPVTVEIVRAPHGDDLARWDTVGEADLLVTSGSLVVSVREFHQEIPRISVPAGRYRVRVYSTITEHDTEARQHYRLVLWPDDTDRPPELLKTPELLE